MRGVRAVAAVLLVLMVFGATPGPSATAGPAAQVYFSESFDAGLGGWWSEPGWSTTDDRAVSGRSAYFGDDKGTPEPDDNDMMFCEGTICSHELRSPVFLLPHGPAYMYLWSYADVAGSPLHDVFQIEVERVAAAERVTVATPALYPGWTVGADLSAFAGQAVRLVFTAHPTFVRESHEGIYIDEVVVTDRFVETETRIGWQAAGPAAAVTFRPEPDARAVIQIVIEGSYVGPAMGYLAAVERNGVAEPYSGMVSGSGTWARLHMQGTDPDDWMVGVGTEATLQVLGIRLVDQDLVIANFGSGTLRLTATLYLANFDPEITGYAVALFGIENATATTTLVTQSEQTLFSAALGGEQSALAFPSGFDATALATAGETLVAMVDGSLVRSTAGPSLAWFPVHAQHLEGVTVSGPEGPLPRNTAYTTTPGTWRVDVASAANTADWPFPWVLIAEVPPFLTPTPVDGPDLSGIPAAEVASETADTEQARHWVVVGPMACQVAVAGVTTPPGCHLHPLFFSHDSFRIASRADLRAITFSIASPADWLGPLDVTDTVNGYCLRLVSPAALATEACADGNETVTLIEGNGALLEDDTVLAFEVRVDDPGVALIERWRLDLTAHYGTA